MTHRPIAPAPMLLAACLVLASGAARAQGEQVDIQVMNRSFQPIAVEVFDDVCRQPVFSGEIMANASVAVTACPDPNGLATITVLDRLRPPQDLPAARRSLDRRRRVRVITPLARSLDAFA